MIEPRSPEETIDKPWRLYETFCTCGMRVMVVIHESTVPDMLEVYLCKACRSKRSGEEFQP